MLKDSRVKYRVVSVKHLIELQKYIDKLYQEKKISQNKILQSYIGTFKFQIPENFPDAKNIVILALESKLALVNFTVNGKKREVMIPPNYFRTQITREDVNAFVINEIIKIPGYRVEQTRGIHLKLLTVSSGLGRYGKNNICYVDEFGSLVGLYAFFTNYDFQEDSWEEVKMLDQCKNCSICINKCPTQCISRENFIINVDKCLPLYNEIEGEFPNWIKADAHNALIGCMICQKYCPANKVALKNVQRLEDINEAETKVILDGKGDEKNTNSVGQKLHMFDTATAKDYLPVLQRNLKALLK